MGRCQRPGGPAVRATLPAAGTAARAGADASVHRARLHCLAASLALLAAAALVTPAGAQRATMVDEAHGGQRGATVLPPMRDRMALQASRPGLDVSEPVRWVGEARDAARQGRTAEAAELLERAETRLLTRSAPAAVAGQPADAPALRRLASARRALRNNDRLGATEDMDAAMAAIRMMPDGDMATGAGPGLGPIQGGGHSGTGMQGQDPGRAPR